MDLRHLLGAIAGECVKPAENQLRRVCSVWVYNEPSRVITFDLAPNHAEDRNPSPERQFAFYLDNLLRGSPAPILDYQLPDYRVLIDWRQVVAVKVELVAQ